MTENEIRNKVLLAIEDALWDAEVDGHTYIARDVLASIENIHSVIVTFNEAPRARPII